MDLLQISRDIKSNPNDSMVPVKGLEISLEEFLKEVKQYDCTVSIQSYEFEGKVAEYANCKFMEKEKRIFLLTHDEGQITISYDGRAKDIMIDICSNLADALGAYLLTSVNLEYPKLKVIAARNRLAKKAKQDTVTYQKESFGGNNTWLAIKAKMKTVVNYYNLEEDQQMDWAAAIATMYKGEGIFVFEFRGWTFLAGPLIVSLFYPFPEAEKDYEQHQVTSLLKWGNTFKDIQFYKHYNKSEYINAFYRVLNGTIQYGEYYSESFERKIGAMPKILKALPDNNANTIASEWSFDPDYLRFCSELEQVNVSVFKIS